MDEHTQDMAGRIMAHAFNDELEKIAGFRSFVGGAIGGAKRSAGRLYRGNTRTPLLLRTKMGIPTPEDMYLKGLKRGKNAGRKQTLKDLSLPKNTLPPFSY